MIPCCLRMPIPLLVILCLAGCRTGPQDGPASASLLTSKDLLAPGPYVSGFRVFTFEDRDRPTMPNGDAEGRSSRLLPTTVWYPVEEGTGTSWFGGFNATPAEEGRPFPLILYCHGFMSWRTDGKYLAEHLARHGYIVACPDFPLTNFFSPGGANVLDVVNQPEDVRFLIDQLLGHHRNPNNPLSGTIDEDRIGVMGLSLGGMTASLVGFHPRLLDPRVKLAVTLAGPGAMFSRSFYENHDIPLLAVYGDMDAIVDYETNALSTLERAGPRARLVSILGGTHVGFSDIASEVMESSENPDRIGCLALRGRTPGNATLIELLGGPEKGILEADTPPPCQVKSFPRSLRPSRQQALTILAVFSFFESVFAEDPQERSRAARFLDRTLAEENPEVVIGGTGDVCGTCVSTEQTSGCREGFLCVENMCVRPGGNLPGECCDQGPARCSEDSYCQYQTCEASPMYPPPKEEIETSTGIFPFNGHTVIITPPAPSPTDETAARLLQDQIREVYGYHLSIRPPAEGDPPENAVLLGTPENHPAVRILLDGLGLSPPDRGPSPNESYLLSLGARHIVIAGRGNPGVLHGAQALKQLIRNKAEKNADGILEGVTVRDWPDAQQRMFQILLAHYYVPKDADGDGERDPYKFVSVPFHLDTAYEYIHVLSELRFNSVLVKMDDMVAWKNLPEPESNALSVDEFMEWVREANAYGLNVVPLLTGSSSSYGWIGTREHPVEYTEEYSVTHNAEHLRIYKNLIQEIIDTFRPIQPLRYFHIGMDEDCKFGPRSLETHEEWVKESHDLITSNHVRPMIWHDTWLQTEAYKNNHRLYPEMHVVVWDYNEPVPVSTMIRIKDVARRGMEVSWALFGNGTPLDFERWFDFYSLLQKGFVGTRWTKEGTLCREQTSPLFTSTVNQYIRKNAHQFWNASRNGPSPAGSRVADDTAASWSRHGVRAARGVHMRAMAPWGHTSTQQ